MNQDQINLLNLLAGTLASLTNLQNAMAAGDPLFAAHPAPLAQADFDALDAALFGPTSPVQVLVASLNAKIALYQEFGRIT